MAGAPLRTRELAGTSRGSEVPVVEVTRAYQFSAAHRLHNPRFDPVENARLYGRCNNPSGHGHTYRLEVTIRGPVSPDTGRVEDAYHLDALVHDRIVSRFDRANLDDLITPTDGPTSTSEVVAGLLWRLLESAVPAGRLHRLRLEETPNNFLELERDGAGQSSPARPSFPPGHSCQKVSAP